MAALVLPLAVATTTVQAATGPIGTAAGFEDNDGNLAPSAPINMDWNSFSPVTWTGTAPYQNASKVFNGWAFVGLTDAQATNSDTGYSGGVKQDVDCAGVTGSKAPNKDDLKRIYLASKSVNGHIYLMLAWERITQNSTTASAHVGFEFNQGTSGACPTGSDGLVHRTPGDLLFVYDFTGGSAGVATLTVRKWVTSGACDISSDSAPCWGVAQDLTASGFAEAAVDDGAAAFPFPVSDTLPPGGTDSLGQSEFGEAGADLTAAGVFPANTCLTLGKVEGVSRSSGNSGNAAMEDLVGPGTINISNCGAVTIIKHTDPRGINQNFGYSTNIPSGAATGAATFSKTPDSTGTTTTFTLNDNGNTTGDSSTNTEAITNVQPGSYTVTEGAEPNGFVLESLICSNGTGGETGSQDATNPAQANITITSGGTLTCTYVNQQQLGAIKITKTSSKPSGTHLAGAKFTITGPGGYSSGTLTSGADGTVCVDNLAFGSYTVTETAAPAGYAIDTTTGQSVTVNANAKCSDATFVGATITFTDTPLTDISASASSEAVGGTQSTITCVVSGTTTNVGNSPQGPSANPTVSATGLKPGTYVCTIVVDP